MIPNEELLAAADRIHEAANGERELHLNNPEDERVNLLDICERHAIYVDDSWCYMSPSGHMTLILRGEDFDGKRAAMSIHCSIDMILSLAEDISNTGADGFFPDYEFTKIADIRLDGDN